MRDSELVRLAKKFKIPIETRPLPDAEDVEQLVAQRLTALLEGAGCASARQARR